MCATLADLAAEIVAAAPVRAFFQALVERLYRQGTGSASRVARALVLTQPPSIERGEITDKGSINQRAVLLHRPHWSRHCMPAATPASSNQKN